MQFFKQLWLLIWKNLSLRKRQVLRNIVEILWPLAIFLILASVRRRKPVDRKQGLFFKPRALPSAGVLPFMQSFLCDYDNPVTAFQEELPDYSNVSLYKLAQDLGPIIQNRTNLELVIRLQDDYDKLMKSLNDLQVLDTTGLTANANLNSLLKNATEVRKFIKDHTTLNVTYINALLHSRINMTQAVELYRQNIGQVSTLDFMNILRVVLTLRPTLCGSPGIKSIFILPSDINANLVQSQLCGLNTAEWGTLFLDIYRNIDLQALNKTFQGTEIFRIYMRQRKVIEAEVTQLLTDVRSLRSLENVLSDLRLASGSLPSANNFTSQNITSGAWQLTSMLCGRKMTQASSLQGLNSSVSQMTETNGGAREKKEKISTKNRTCSNFPLNERTECGWRKITQGTCLSMGCCFDKSTEGKKRCFCKPGNEVCCKRFNKLVTLIGTGGRQFVNLFALILRGKIFYTPDTPQTRKVVQTANLFIKQIESGIRSLTSLKQPMSALINITNTYHNTSNVVRQLLNLEALSVVIGVPYARQAKLLFNQTDLFLKRLYEERGQLQMAYNAIDLIGGILDCYNISDFFQAFPNEEALVKRATDQALDKPLFLSSIVFLNLDAKDGSFPKKVEYKLRLNPAYTPGTKYVRSRYWRPGPSWNGYYGAWTKFYINFGFVFLQDMVDRAIMQIVTNKTISEPGVYTQQFPYPCYIRDLFTRYVASSLPLFMVLAWVYSSAMIVKSIVLEKELRLKEVMKVMGLSNAVHWTAWFITSLLFMLVSVVVLCILFKVGDILLNSNPVVIFWLMSSFGIATISLSCLISVFFSKANVSAACGGIIYFFTYLPYSLTVWFEDQMTYSHKAAANLLSTTGFGMACKYLARWEEQGDGAQWSNYYKSPMPGDDYSLGTCVNMMLLDAFLYFVILWYVENVMPGEYGIPRPWYFPFTKSYWMGYRTKKSRPESYQVLYEMEVACGANGQGDQADGANFEADPSLRVGISIQNLVKVYKRGKKRAVDGLNLKLFEGQVTSLLGHNGAGKSTTMSVLTGLIPPTQGTAVVYGSDIRNDIEGVRQGLGICPQHNVLFDHLTVEEHMWFYAQLKGMPKKDIQVEIEKFLKDVGLPEKRRELSKNLSGGMKRKLSVALAFIANSKTVVLDEPTAGVDPYSRRSIWDLILSYKAGKTILLSTHYMDEADLLGDRISIISHGKLRCCGTPLFLKRRFGEGYHLTVSKNTNPGSLFDENAMKNFVGSYVKGSYLKENSGTEQCFVLPSEERQDGSFKELFENLEKSCKSLGLNSYGLSDTSLEEVFLKATETDENAFDELGTISLTGPAQRRSNSFYDTASLYSSSSNKQLISSDCCWDESSNNRIYCDKKEGVALWLQQFVALLIKRFHHARRGKKGFMSQILLPGVFVAVAMAVSLLRPPNTGLPSLKLSPSQYSDPNYFFISNLNKDSEISRRVTAACIQSPGIGTDCMKPAACSNTPNPFPFASDETRWNFSSTYKNLPNCSCATGKQTCPKNSYGSEPPMRKLSTKDILIDLTGRNISEYLLKTTDDFIKRRYGGLSIGDMARYYPTTNISRRYVEEGTSTTSTSRNIAVSVAGSGVLLNAKVWFNNKGYHAVPTYLNVLNNAILRANLQPGQDPHEYGIVTFNHPMDFNKEQLGDETMMQGFTDLIVSIFVIIALSFVPSSFVVYLVADRNSKSKHLQLVSGLNPVVYWVGNYVWDLINYLIPAAFCLIIFLAFNQKSYVSADNFPATLCLLLLYGWSMTPLMYPTSFFFNVPSTAYIVLICANLFVGIVGTISTFILELFDDDVELQTINGYLKQIFLIFPNYCLGRGLMDLAKNQLTANVYEIFGESRFQSPFKWSLVGRNIVVMFFCGLAYFILTILIQYRFFIKFRPSKPAEVLPKNEEADVSKERMRVQSKESENSDVLRTQDLTKIYKSFFQRKKLLAVDRLSFGVGKGECFGLLGVNGAGKTTTFKMLTGDTDVTAGNAFVGNSSILSDVNNARKQVGYCPQFDAFDELLTAREMLSFYARIRGIQREFIPQVAESGIQTMDLTLYADKICGDYSGGNKRKLSTAISFLGNPQLIFLDEPTTGMDPGARRFLWNIIADIVKNGRSVVLTSHSMEECEALCTRLGIMVNGKFMCFGSPQHLRSKYGDGYTIGLRAKLACMTSVRDFMTTNFPNSVLKDQHHYMLEYQVPSFDLRLSEVFAKLELLRGTKSIDDYSVTQTTLDQIFVNFARKQTEGVELESNDVIIASAGSGAQNQSEA